ncbi:hypothetical protein D3C72_2067490 [compost metagenome]
MKSVGPPAENGTTSVMGLDGQLSARAGPATNAEARHAASILLSVMISPVFFIGMALIIRSGLIY